MKRCSSPYKAQFFGQFCAEHLERAAVVFEVYAGELADEVVGNGAGDFAQQHLVLPVDAIAGHHVPLAGLCHLQHGGNVGRVVLEVAVHGGNVFAARHVYAGHEGQTLAVVFAQFHHPQARMSGGAQFGDGVVAGAVVHIDQLVIYAGEACVQLFEQGPDVVFFIINSDDDGEKR
jgi:energy-converting hydrogenase Eha subunit B